MKLCDWQAVIEEIDWLVESYKILIDSDNEEVVIVKIRFKLINFSILDYFETYDYELGKHKYGFQWMDKYDQLIRRWDNTPHHEYISTFPFHQHVGNEDNVQPSEPMTLSNVLYFISQNLA